MCKGLQLGIGVEKVKYRIVSIFRDLSRYCQGNTYIVSYSENFKGANPYLEYSLQQEGGI